MTLMEISAILLTAAALGSYINAKWIKMPFAIGLMLLAMVAGLLGILLESFDLLDTHPIQQFLSNINFSETIFHGMLSFLLFAGALQINFQELKNAKLPIAITATVSTLISTFLVGFVFYFFANWLGFTQVTLLYALLFGAIISPTDPIAVLAIIKKMNAPINIETKIAGESLFNDGVAIVFFITILELMNAHEVSIATAAHYLLLQAGGGLLFGFIVGLIANQLLLTVKSAQPALLITLAVTTGGYVLAEKLQLSAPLAMVVAGIVIGNKITTKAKPIILFWESTDEILNAVLFILIGLEMMIIKVNGTLALLGVICIFVALIARYLSLALPISLMTPFYKSARGSVMVMTWGGLRGALSIAMVLTLSQQNIKEIFLPCVYFVVVFSIAVQGLTFGKMLKKYEMV